MHISDIDKLQHQQAPGSTTYTHDMFYNYNRREQWSVQDITDPEEDRDRLRHHTYHLHNAPTLIISLNIDGFEREAIPLTLCFLIDIDEDKVEHISTPEYD